MTYGNEVRIRFDSTRRHDFNLRSKTDKLV